MPRTYSITFQPGDEIVHVIAKNFNPVNRAEFNPGVENAPCNRPLRTEIIRAALKGRGEGADKMCMVQRDNVIFGSSNSE
jgi:hypothetical protein